MAIFVVDASVALAWCFEDEASALADGILERLRRGDRIVVPAHWPTACERVLEVIRTAANAVAGRSAAAGR